MDNEILHRYLMNQTSSAEEAKIADWLEADPENQKRLGELCAKIETLALLAPRIEDLYSQNSPGMGLCCNLHRWIIGVSAAIMLLCGSSIYFTNRYVRQQLGGQEQALSAQDSPLQYTFTDGTTVWLNAHGTMEFPAVFTGPERVVRITGEAMFDVAHDEKQPFVVQTTACNIRVLGTKFNVIADAEGKVFEAALLRGRVAVTSRITGEQVILTEDESVTLRDGALVRCDVAEPDDFLWTSGFINLKGHTFNELIGRFQQVFGVSIHLEDVKVSESKYWSGKIRIQDGIDNAMKVLQNAFPIQYSFDTESRTIVIRSK